MQSRRLLACVSILVCASLPAQVVLRVPVGGAPVTFDPHRMPPPFPFHAQFAMQLYETPLETRIDEKGLLTVVPALCEIPVISADGLNVRLKVRKGAFFHDDPCFDGGTGREVAPRDVVYSILRHADPGVGSAAFPLFVEHRFKGLDEWRAAAAKVGRADYDAPPPGLRVEGDDVVFDLVAPYPQLRALLTQPWAAVVPLEALRKYGTGFSDHPVGSGPFRLGDVDPVRVRFVKNPRYRILGLPKVDELRLEIVPDPAAQGTRFLAGDLDIVTVLAANERMIVDGKQQILQPLKSKGMKVIDGLPLSVGYLAVNMASPVLAKKELRQALTLALDRDRLTREGQGERIARADYALPPCFPEAAQLRLDTWDLAKRDVARAKTLLAQAGWGDPKQPLELMLDAPSDAPDPRAEKASRLMVAQLAEIGVKLTVRSETFGKFLQRVSSGDFHLAWVSWFADYPDAENFLLLFRSDQVAGGDFGSNYGHYKDARVDELYLRVAGRLPGRERTADVTELLRKVRDDCVWVPLNFPAPLCALGRGVDGFRANVLDFSLRDVSKKN